MAKRFTDTEKWKNPFIRKMKAPYKLFWLYLMDECDHAGIWLVDFDVAQIKIGEKLDPKIALEQFQSKVIDIGHDRWFVPDFISFQYGVLNPENRAHNSVIQILSKHGLIDEHCEIKPLTSPLEGAMDKDKDMDMVKDLDKDKPREAKNGKQIPPLIEDVIAYCQERGFGVDAHKWFDFYSSKGWLVGKSKMVDWQAAVRTWEKDKPQVEPTFDLYNKDICPGDDWQWVYAPEEKWEKKRPTKVNLNRAW